MKFVRWIENAKTQIIIERDKHTKTQLKHENTEKLNDETTHLRKYMQKHATTIDQTHLGLNSIIIKDPAYNEHIIDGVQFNTVDVIRADVLMFKDWFLIALNCTPDWKKSWNKTICFIFI